MYIGELQAQTYFIVKQSTHTEIQSGNLVIADARIELEESIEGEGITKLIGTHMAVLHAHGNQVNTLIIESETGAMLKSNLVIGNTLSLNQGNLLLNDCNILLLPFATIHESAKGKLVFNGQGKVIDLNLQPLAGSDAPVKLLKDIPAITKLNFEHTFQAINFNGNKFQSEHGECFLTIPTPPPKHI